MKELRIPTWVVILICILAYTYAFKWEFHVVGNEIYRFRPLTGSIETKNDQHDIPFWGRWGTK